MASPDTDPQPSSAAMMMWTMILVLIAGAILAFISFLIFHTALPKRVGGVCLGMATALTLVRWIMQRFEK